MSVKNSILAIPLKTFNSASLLAGYQPINPGGLDFPCVFIRINNSGNSALTISYDGITDHEYAAANETLQLEAQANSLPSAFACNFKKGTVVYVKGTAGVGTIALSGYYQSLGA